MDTPNDQYDSPWKRAVVSTDMTGQLPYYIADLLNSQVWQELETIEEKENMEYITSIERLGMVKGRVEGQYSLLKRLLERRFGLLPEWASEKLKNAKSKELEAWADAFFTAPTLEAVFKKSDVS